MSVAFTDEEGVRWQAEIVSHGRTSDYLNPRVHKAVLQFTCLDRRTPRRYVGYPQDRLGPLDGRTQDELRELFARAASH